MDLEKEMVGSEAAKFLGIDKQKLNRLRRQGKIRGARVGTSNLYMYTLEDLRRADLRPEKRGPKHRA